MHICADCWYRVCKVRPINKLNFCPSLQIDDLPQGTESYPCTNVDIRIHELRLADDCYNACPSYCSNIRDTVC